MTRRVVLCAVAAVVILGPRVPLRAQQPGGASELQQLREQVRRLIEQHDATEKTSRDGAVRALFAAAQTPASALEFYLNSVMEVNFAGQAREKGGFRDWREKNEARLKSKAFARAAQLHLTYLALTCQRASGAKPEELVPQLLEYTAVLNADTNGELRAEKEMLGEPVGSSLFVRRLALNRLVNKLDDWEQVPGDVDAIFAATILPVLRKTKDPRVLMYWDERIQREEAASRESGRSFQQSRFSEIGRPGLLWKRAEEYFALGEPMNGLQEMLAICQKYPNHPSAGEWLAEIGKRIDALTPPPAPAATGSESATGTPATAGVE